MMDREALREYAGGALWVLPSIAGVAALAVGSVITQIDVPPDSPLALFAFQGTADDARALLVTISTTVVTTIALVLGLTVVALQLSSTQFSPRLLRNFLRDRPNQIVLSIFVASFTYSAAGLFTVGVESGTRVEDYPRLAVSGAVLLLFVSLASVVYFADHLAHSIQIDAITRRAERGALDVLRATPIETDEASPQPPEWAVTLISSRSGYVQAVHPERIVVHAGRRGVTVRLRPHVGEHVMAGTTLAWLWAPSASDAPPDRHEFQRLMERHVRIGFERTLEQDVGFGIRQLTDVACKALSPAVNDPYTAMQSVDHLKVIFCQIAARPLGDTVERDTAGRPRVIVPGRTFEELLSITCGLIRRFGAREPTVLLAMLRMLDTCSELVRDGDVGRLRAIDEQGALIQSAGEAEIGQLPDLVPVQAAAESLRERIRSRLPAPVS
jgi:uncharacterized membrane protein